MTSTWAERLQHDESLRAFVTAEVARPGIELDTLRYQRVQYRQQIATLTGQLDAARGELRLLRRLLRRDRGLIARDAA